jgi:hypothetical protein
MVVVSLTSLNKKKIRSFIDSFDTVLTDCDGTYILTPVDYFMIFGNNLMVEE